MAAVLALLLGCTMLDRPVLAQTTAELKPLGPDEARQVDRYRVVLRSGATLWDLSTTALPLTCLGQSDQQAYQLVLESFQRTFPDRPPDAIRPDETFTLEVPLGTFVAEQRAREGDSILYRSFQGDRLTYSPRHPAVLYRLVRKESPERAEVSLRGEADSPVELAREIYQVDPPDFLQVRAVRAALQDPNTPLRVDLRHPHLDDFRNYRARATSVQDGTGGRKIYAFGPEDADIPYLRVEDTVGDQHDPAAFAHEFRLAFYRDGTIHRYVLTDYGDTLGAWTKPDPARWPSVVPWVEAWQTGTVEPLPPFAPAVSELGTLIPGRLLVLRFVPQVALPSSSAVELEAAFDWLQQFTRALKRRLESPSRSDERLEPIGRS